jgi:hypothetical protein
MYQGGALAQSGSVGQRGVRLSGLAGRALEAKKN